MPNNNNEYLTLVVLQESDLYIVLIRKGCCPLFIDLDKDGPQLACNELVCIVTLRYKIVGMEGFLYLPDTP